MGHGMLHESGFTTLGMFLLVAQVLEERFAVPTVHKPGSWVSLLPLTLLGSTYVHPRAQK